ncbi:MAG: iron-containing alcohol dehydrogenase [Planctomycetota bacterium]|nr:iron-containing alcohol dehydrogenase [Planctomycetota bacterium]
MPPFEFTSVSRIVFGRGQFKRIGELAAEFGRKALIVTNADRTGKLGLLTRLNELLTAHGLTQALFRVDGEPRAEDVDRGVEAARQAQCELLIAVGGGSAIDAGKAIAGLLANGGVALDYMEVVGKGQKITRPAVPWLAVPTTAGTGAEATRNAVIGCPEKHFKASIRSHHLLPRVALVDAELGLHVRPEITARSGMDALTQLIEAYTSTGAEPLTDALALEGVSRAARSLRRAYHRGDDLDAREDMALAALLSGICLSAAGLGAVHGFAAPLGAQFPAPHGAVCAALLPHVLAANIAALRAGAPESPVLARYAAVGRTLAGDASLSQAQALDACGRITRDLVAELSIPRLGQYGITESDIAGLVALARQSSSMRYNPAALSADVLAEVLRRAL